MCVADFSLINWLDNKDDKQIAVQKGRQGLRGEEGTREEKNGPFKSKVGSEGSEM